MMESVGRLVASAGCSGLLLLGCGAKSVELDRLIEDGRDNEVRAVAKYQHLRIKVTGIVADVALTKVERITAMHTRFYSIIHSREEGYPYVVLASPGGASEDYVVCYFAEKHMRELGDLTDGLKVTLEGAFQEYSEDEGIMMVVLVNCERD